MKGLILYTAFAIWILAAGFCSAVPKPAIVQGPQDWTLNTEFEHPQHITLRTGLGRPKFYWYTILTLTNKAYKDVDFYPNCELMTDTFELIPAGKNVSPAVYREIKTRHRSIYRFLEPLEKVDNKFLQGRDNTKDIAVIFGDFDHQTKIIKIFIAGLSNETVIIENPIMKDNTGKPVKIFLRKTLELTYDVTGDPTYRGDTKLIYKGKRWVMR